jgi:hypothetical protein
MKTPFVVFFVLSLFLVACNVPRLVETADTDQSQIETIVATTAQALTQHAVTSPQQPSSTASDSLSSTITPTLTPNITDTPEPGFGSISGNIYGYPYGDLPQLAIVAHEQQPPYHYWYLILGVGNSFFSMDGYVSSGKYQVVAYDSSGHAGGCTSIVEVKNNEMVTCDITNWGGGYPAKPAGVP